MCASITATWQCMLANPALGSERNRDVRREELVLYAQNSAKQFKLHGEQERKRGAASVLLFLTHTSEPEMLLE